jgi:hypothetical protein
MKMTEEQRKKIVTLFPKQRFSVWAHFLRQAAKNRAFLGSAIAPATWLRPVSASHPYNPLRGRQPLAYSNCTRFMVVYFRLDQGAFAVFWLFASLCTHSKGGGRGINGTTEEN